MMSALINPLRYPAPIWELFNRAPNAGTFEADTPDFFHAKVGTPANAAMLELSIIWREHHVVDARFRAYGCPATVAVGAWLACWCRGRGEVDLSRICAADIGCALEMVEERAHCSLMGEDVVKAVLTRLIK